MMERLGMHVVSRRVSSLLTLLLSQQGHHPNVITFVGAITSPSSKGHLLHFSLVTEYCPFGSLYDFLVVKKTKVPLIVLLRMARDIAAGVLVSKNKFPYFVN